MTVSRGRTRKQPLDYRKEKTGYCKLEEEELAHTVWRTRGATENKGSLRMASLKCSSYFEQVSFNNKLYWRSGKVHWIQ